MRSVSPEIEKNDIFFKNYIFRSCIFRLDMYITVSKHSKKKKLKEKYHGT